MGILNLPAIREFSSLRLKTKLACLFYIIATPFVILGLEHIDLLHKYLAIQNTSLRPDGQADPGGQIRLLTSEIVYTKLLLAISLLSLSFTVFLILKSARLQSAKLHQTLEHFANARYDRRILAHHMGDLERAADEINLLGLRQTRTRQKVFDTMTEVISASDGLNDVVSKSTAGTSELMQSVLQVTTAIEEMSNSMVSAAENAEKTNRISEDTTSLASEGEAKVKQMHQEMITIGEVVDATNNAISSLQDRSYEVSNIVTVIKGIAEQTNLLALNAAIEAARAGEQGRGFAVVADEVRQLATRSSEATTEISELIGKMQAEVDYIVDNISTVHASVGAGMEMSSEAEHSLTIINRRAQETKTMIDEISTSLGQQKIAGTEISNSMHRVSSVAEVNKKSVEEINSAALYLSAQSKILLNDIKS